MGEVLGRTVKDHVVAKSVQPGDGHQDAKLRAGEAYDPVELCCDRLLLVFRRCNRVSVDGQRHLTAAPVHAHRDVQLGEEALGRVVRDLAVAKSA